MGSGCQEALLRVDGSDIWLLGRRGRVLQYSEQGGRARGEARDMGFPGFLQPGWVLRPEGVWESGSWP